MGSEQEKGYESRYVLRNTIHLPSYSHISQRRPVLDPRPEGRRPYRAHRLQRPRSRRLRQATWYVPPQPHLPYLLVLVTDAKMPTERDEKDAIDESNILDERTRGAAKEQGSYAEPGDDEGLEGALEGNDGRSAGRQ